MVTRVIGFVFLGLQLVAAFLWLGAREQRAFVTPYDGRTSYRLFVTVEGRALGTDEIASRYHIPASEIASRTPEAIKSIVRHVEGVYAPDQHAIVRLHYKLNGEDPEIWLWPES